MDNARTCSKISEGISCMKIVIRFIIFIIYTIVLFFIQDIVILAGIFVLQVLCMLLCKVSVRETWKTILYLMPFIMFTVLINIWAMGLIEAIKIGIRLIMVCHITYIFGKTTTAMQIAKAIQMLLFPLKWVGINVNNIGIMVSLAITFIPIIKQEIQSIKYSLIAKGCNMSFSSQIKHINYIMGPLFYSLLRKVKEIEDSLRSKAYIEE